MKKRRVQEIPWILAMVLVMLLSRDALAVKAGETVQVTRTYVSPRYEGKISEAELEEYLDRNGQRWKIAGKTCTTEAEVAEMLRSYLVKRQDTFSISVKLKAEKKKGEEETEAELNKIMDRIYNLSLMETDKPCQ